MFLYFINLIERSNYGYLSYVSLLLTLTANLALSPL